MRLHFVSHSAICRFVILGFRREIDENCALLGHYTASSGNLLPTFRDKLSIPSSRVKKTVPIGCPETSVINYHNSLCNDPEERSSLCFFVYLVVCLFVCLVVWLFICLFVWLVGWLVGCMFICFITFRQDRP